MSELFKKEIIEKLEKIDTPTISNVVASYPRSDDCLKLYDAWYGEWYTDTTIKCVYPELGPKVGYVATVIFSERSDKYTVMDRRALPDHIEARAPAAMRYILSFFMRGFSSRMSTRAHYLACTLVSGSRPQ